MTLRARKVLFDAGRPPSVAADEAREQNGAPTGEPEQSEDPMGVTSGGAESAASAEDLPF